MTASDTWQAAPGGRPSRRWWLILAGVLAASIFMRFYHLAELPAGMHYDEAYNGLDATRVLDLPVWRWPVFFTGNYGREPLHIYLMALAQAALGPGIAALRFVSALSTVALGLALAWLAWEMAPSLGLDRRRLSLWAAASPLTVLLCQILSRYATRNMPLAVLSTLLMAASWRAWRTGTGRWWLAAGVLGGLCFYTYLPARLLPLVMIAMLVIAWVQERPRLRRQGPGIVLGLTVATVVVAPLAWYLACHPEYIMQRTAQVSVAGDDWLRTLASNTIATLGMAFIAGDNNIRNNVPGRPLFDAIMAAAFVVGTAWTLLHPRRRSCLFVLLWLGVMLLPTALSSDAPHYLRSVGALPALALLAAIGVEVAVASAQKHLPHRARWFEAAGWLAMAASAGITWHQFSSVWASDPALYFARDAGLLAVAQAIGKEVAEGGEQPTIYLSPSGWDHPTTEYGLVGIDPPVTLHGFDGRVCVRVPEGAARYVVLTGEDFRGANLLRTYLPNSTERTLVYGPGGEPLALELRQPADGATAYPEMTAVSVTLGDGISLGGYWLSTSPLQPGERLYVRLQWRAVSTPLGEYTAFAKLLAIGADGTLEQVAGVDSEPGKGTCSTGSWLPGETVVDEMEIAVPPDLDAGSEYWVAVGLYTLADGMRLEVDGRGDGQVLLGPLVVADPG